MPFFIKTFGKKQELRYRSVGKALKLTRNQRRSARKRIKYMGRGSYLFR
jgi:hypothetical protein